MRIYNPLSLSRAIKRRLHEELHGSSDSSDYPSPDEGFEQINSAVHAGRAMDHLRMLDRTAKSLERFNRRQHAIADLEAGVNSEGNDEMLVNLNSPITMTTTKKTNTAAWAMGTLAAVLGTLLLATMLLRQSNITPTPTPDPTPTPNVNGYDVVPSVH